MMIMTDSILEQITQHAERVFPHEACGLILNTHYGYQVLECANTSHEPESSFLLDPVIFAQHQDKVAAVYHSHPNRSAKPSQADMASAERCNVPFLILSYPSGELFNYTPKGVLPAPYEGRHFVYGVMDCLSLVVDYYRHELGILIDEGDRLPWGWWLDDANQHAAVNFFKRQGFVELSKDSILQPHDIILMALGGGPCANHAAIYQGNSHILHCPNISTPSRGEMYGQYWRQNTQCYLRHPDVGHVSV